MKKNKFATFAIVVVTVVSLIGLTGLFNLGSRHTSQNQSTKQNSGGVPCLFSEAFHIHPHLKISVDGKDEALPGGIGILPGCTREIHTHQTDGVIHIEGAQDRGYTFADFLSVWGKSLDRSGYKVKMTVDGREVSDPNFKLTDGQQILLEYTKI